jgi:hypothetical protein
MRGRRRLTFFTIEAVEEGQLVLMAVVFQIADRRRLLSKHYTKSLLALP